MPWEKADKLAKDSMIVSVWGPPKTGKTQFALSFPGPIYFHNFDWGLAHHLARDLGKEVFVANYITERPDLDAAEARQLLSAFERDYAAALKNTEGTIVIDTSTQLWQLASKVFLDDIKAKRKDGNIYPFDYANANAYFQNLINQVKKTPLNMVLIQRAREKYDAAGKATGEHEPQGNNQVSYLTQVQLHAFKDGGKHYGEIELCWDDSRAEGIRLENPNYDKLKQFIQSMRTAA